MRSKVLTFLLLFLTFISAFNIIIEPGKCVEMTLVSNDATKIITLDANITPEEWSDAARYTFNLTYSASSQIHVFLKNDNENLFVGINITNVEYVYMYVVTYFDMDHSNSTSYNDTIIGFPTKYDDRTIHNNSLHIFKHNSVTGNDEYTTSSEQWALGKAFITEGIEGISNISCEYVIPKKFVLNQTGVPAKINIDVNQFYSIVDEGGTLPVYLRYRNVDRFLKLTLDPTTRNLDFFSQFNTESDDTNNSPNIWMIIGIIGASIIVIPTIYCIILISVHKKSMKKRQLERQRQRLTEQNELPSPLDEDSTTNGGWK